MTDLFALHGRVARNIAITYEEMLAAASLIGRQPPEDWSMLRATLGLDGVPTRLNPQAKSRYKLEQQAIESG